jgi:hypothetical protein
MLAQGCSDHRIDPHSKKIRKTGSEPSPNKYYNNSVTSPSPKISIPHRM